MFKAKDLRERSADDLRELEKTIAKDVFQNRFKNFTNRLDDTSSIRKAKKDLARVKTVLAEIMRKNLGQGAGAAASTESAAAEAAPAEAPKPKAKKAAAPKAAAKSAKPAAEKAEKPAKKTAAKKSTKSEAK